MISLRADVKSSDIKDVRDSHARTTAETHESPFRRPAEVYTLSPQASI